jgi:hypothetical protein
MFTPRAISRSPVNALDSITAAHFISNILNKTPAPHWRYHLSSFLSVDVQKGAVWKSNFYPVIIQIFIKIA